MASGWSRRPGNGTSGGPSQAGVDGGSHEAGARATRRASVPPAERREEECRVRGQMEEHECCAMSPLRGRASERGRGYRTLLQGCVWAVSLAVCLCAAGT